MNMGKIARIWYIRQQNQPAEDRADAIANNRNREITSARIDDLTEFLKNTIHEDYPLIDHLQKGGLPPRSRTEDCERRR